MENLWQVLDEKKTSSFSKRHNGPRSSEQLEMLKKLSVSSIEELIGRAIPESIRYNKNLSLPEPISEHEALNELATIMEQNQVKRSLIGMGYYDCLTPSVIQRNILENPAWYTQYTPYQAEIAQGRLEALLNFQTMICDLTGLEISNASLLDESTAAAEAMILSRYFAPAHSDKNLFFVSQHCHPQTIALLETRAKGLGIKIQLIDETSISFEDNPFGMLLQYPHSNGELIDPTVVIESAKNAGVLVSMACDLLSLCLIKPPGELGADIAFGSSQRFGVPLGFGGPHAAFFATKDEYKRRLPGRLVGVSKDADGRTAFRLSLQTREQHIRRDKATSNICTAQVLLAVMSSMYAVYHGADGLSKIATKTAGYASVLSELLKRTGFTIKNKNFFDTIVVTLKDRSKRDHTYRQALQSDINLRIIDENSLGISLDEKTDLKEILKLANIFDPEGNWDERKLKNSLPKANLAIPENLLRHTPFLTHEIFKLYRSETDMMRYMRQLERRDLSLTQSMIPLGSCTMKLNAASELTPITWPEVNSLHPFVPSEQAKGYHKLFNDLESWLSEITGFDAISLQPNSGAQGEYAGLMVIARYHEKRGQSHRNICLIPSSAHGTNPASAVLAGFKVVVVKCDSEGNIDTNDLKAKIDKHSQSLGALMITYPSTHGVFEENITGICELIHSAGGQVYMDGANLNAQIGLCRPGDYGPDVCHMNLHKTFCIPHGGGGPGMGPIGVKKHLAAYLPTHPLVDELNNQKDGIGPISAAPWGSPSILPISWMYIRMMGSEGLTEASKLAILNANYVAKKLDDHFPVVYKGSNGLVAHECIIDLKEVKKSADVSVDDIAKRLIDYGYHAPTVSWPVPNSMMIEPTESESKAELDRFCEAMIAIRHEIKDIEEGRSDPINNVLKRAPHTQLNISDDSWDRPYSREKAAFPKEWVKRNKFWSYVSRVDNVYGDRNLSCSCPPLSSYGSIPDE